MKAKAILVCLMAAVISLISGWAAQPSSPPEVARQAIQAPTLKWSYGGCFSSWCETGWYSSPAVADLDGDGAAEVIASAYSIAVLNGNTGALKWRMQSGHDRDEGTTPGNVGRTWPGVVTADVDGDGLPEIVTAHGGGYVSVYDHQGYFQSGWPKRPVESELRGLSVADLDNNGDMEIVVTAARGSKTNTWVYEHTGALRAGWPQLSNDTGYAWGVYNDNAALGDLDGDGAGEIVVPSDVHYINAYEANGAQIPANAMYGGRGWGRVGIWESLTPEVRGWGLCDGSRVESYRTNFADGPAVIADVNGDGVVEVVATGNVYDCDAGYPPSRYTGVYIFNADRSRFNAGGYNWQTVPVNTGAPLVEDYEVIESAQSNPAVADLDGDGKKEILFASYDGRMHAFWLDKTEHGHWPYSVYNSADGFYSFASEPAVADLDNNGRAEVIFTSWTQIGSHSNGKLYVLDYQGNVLHRLDLPAPRGGSSWNGALPAPTLANIDADADLEIVLNTAHSGFVTYDLPGTAQARVLWGTGRGNYQRNGAYLKWPTVTGVNKTTPAPGDHLVYTIRVKNPGLPAATVRLTDTVPAEIISIDAVHATSGSYGRAGNVITWTERISPAVQVTLTFTGTLANLTDPTAVVNTARFDDGAGNVTSLPPMVSIVNARKVYLPLVRRQ